MNHFLIIGYGGAGKRFVTNFKNLYTQVKISILHITSSKEIFSNNCDGIVTHFFDLNEVLMGYYDGVIIATPTSEHLKYAELFIGHSKFILIDKPLDSDLSTCISFYNSYKNSVTKIYVNFQRRYTHCWNELKQKISQNEQHDGPFRYGLIHINSYLPSWRPNQDFHSLYAARRELGGGVLLTECHEIDLVEWTLGEIKEVSAKLQQTKTYGLTVEDAAHMTALVQTSYGIKPVTFVLDFMNSSLCRNSIFEFSNNRYEIDEINDCCHDLNNTCLNNIVEKRDAHLALLEKVCSTLNDEDECIAEIPSLYDGVRVNAVIEAAKISNKKKCSVQVVL